MSEYKPIQGTTLRIVDGEYRLGFCQEKEWVELGRAVLAIHRNLAGLRDRGSTVSHLIQ